ncbi:MAG: sodium:solute symporter, partial [Kiritimatiellae bacterium]|nr:sodium:solute symporter [Kiritimatiellia bacterium]
MSFRPLDWLILIASLAPIFYGAMRSRQQMRSVADFLAAGRTAGRYLLTVASGMAALGAISIIGEFELMYKSGFCQAWWGLSMGAVVVILSVSGWVVYRFRQTRALTLAQFFEARYSRNFRVFAGLVAFISGLINFGIFPSVGSRFFIFYLGLPPTFLFAGVECSTYAV